MELRIKLLGQKRVATEIKGIRIETDQPVEDGGSGSAPSPFDLFLASIGTCAGFYVQSFCQARGIATGDVELVEHVERDDKTHLVSSIRLEVLVPENFPEKYRQGLIAAVNGCTVKKHLQNPPKIDVTVRPERRP